MKKLFTVALGLAVAVLPVLGVGVATAQDERDCTQAQREVARVEARVAARVTEERTAEDRLLKEARDALQLLKNDEIPNGDQRDLISAAEAVVQLRERELNTDSKRLVDLRADLAAAVKVRDEACDEDPTPTPTPTPAPTTPPVADDVDCDEVSDARAQEILDADRSDPNDLDDDRDGVACEDELELNPRPVVVPQGGVQTDGGVE